LADTDSFRLHSKGLVSTLRTLTGNG
jgi:hypothetical protein